MNSLGKFHLIKKTREFRYFYNTTSKFHTKYFIIFYKSNPTSKVGFVASKKIGNAIKRNMAKRRLRALIIAHQNLFIEGSFVFVAKFPINEVSYQDVEKSLLFILKKIKNV